MESSIATPYFEKRGIDEEIVKDARIGYSNGALTYPCIGKDGRLLGVHHKSESRNSKGKRRQWWKGYAEDMPKKGHGKHPGAPAKIIPFGLETLKDLAPGSQVALCCGEEDALSLRQVGYTSLSQPGAGLLEPVYARELAGLEVVVFYDAGEEREAHKDARKLMEAGAKSVHVIRWPPDAPNGADVNGKLVEKPDGLAEWAAEMIRTAQPISSIVPEPIKRGGRADNYNRGPVIRNGSRDSHEFERTISACDLLALELPPVRWAVPDILPEGVTLLAGKPKLGKSWMAFGLSIAVANGGVALGTKPVERGDSLYLALEDNERRLQRRLRKMLVGSSAPERLHITTQWSRLDEGGVEALEGWLKAHPDARMIVIDTLAKIRPRQRGQNVYAEDYAALEKLLPLAAEHGVAILIVHHLRKGGADDPMDEISGSTGLSGGVDGALVLKRDRGQGDAYLHVDGRDIEEPAELALTWNANTASWTLAGNADEFRLSKERSDVLRVVRDVDEPVGPKYVAEALDKKGGAVRELMSKMAKDGLLKTVEYGKYTATDTPDTSDSSHSSEDFGEESVRLTRTDPDASQSRNGLSKESVRTVSTVSEEEKEIF